VILPDANVLLYAVNTASDQHRTASRALAQGLADPRGVAFAWISLLAFLRLSTRPGIFERALSMEQALQVVAHWLDQPRAQVIHPTTRHRDVLGRLLLTAGAGSSLTSDAHLAALALEHGATLLTFDRDFERFAGLEWRIPQRQ
jgi:toxin-antitoxin system PIN domain toxin